MDVWGLICLREVVLAVVDRVLGTKFVQKCPNHPQFTPTPVFLSLTLFVAMGACRPTFELQEDGPPFAKPSPGPPRPQERWTQQSSPLG